MAVLTALISLKTLFLVNIGNYCFKENALPSKKNRGHDFIYLLSPLIMTGLTMPVDPPPTNENFVKSPTPHTH